MILIYASPSAVVISPAVAPEITPPATVPAPGMSFNIPVTTVLPSTAAPAVPKVEETNEEIMLLLISMPKITVIPAIIATCVGIIRAASATGIGAKPSPKVPKTVPPTKA